MTERQHEANLEAAYQRLIAHPEAIALERERFEELLLTDLDEFHEWAISYIKWSVGLNSFFDWCWDKREKELTPAHSQAWEDELPSNAEYWNWNDDRV